VFTVVLFFVLALMMKNNAIFVMKHFVNDFTLGETKFYKSYKHLIENQFHIMKINVNPMPKISIWKNKILCQKHHLYLIHQN